MITVDGTSLQHYGWNIRTVGSRLRSAAPRGANTEVAGADGAVWQRKPLSELQFELSMWIAGCLPDGTMPTDRVGRQVVRDRVDALLGLLWRQDRLVRIEDTDSSRYCMAEVLAPFDPTTMAGATRAEFAVECNVPDGCWWDTSQADTGPVALTSGGDMTLTGLGGANLPPGQLQIQLTGPGRNVRIETADGAWLAFNGDLPATGSVLITDTGAAWHDESPTVSLMSAVRWAPGPQLLPLGGGPDPVVHVTAENTSVDSRIRVTGTRRWRTA